MTLRTVLETTPDITLDRLTQFFEGHYGQKNAHDLRNAIKNLFQFLVENAYTFVMRCLEARQKILLVSQKSYDISYVPGFIDKLFLRKNEQSVWSPLVVQ